MGGCSFEDDCELISPRTLVLVDGQRLNVIDTPGLFDSTLDFDFIGKEIVNCINMAKDGIHAFLVVVSTRSRFSEDEKAAVSSLLTLFGRKIYDYMILVFTGGDELDEDGESLEDFLRDSSEALKETLTLCNNRCVLFDNKTKNETIRSNQVQKLLFLVDVVWRKNGGKPYTNEIFTEVKNQIKELEDQETSIHEKKFKRVYDMVESKLKQTTLKLEQQLEEEQAARVKAEKKAEAAKKEAEASKKEAEAAKKKAEAAKKESEAEKRKMKEKVEKAKKGQEELLRKKEEEKRKVEAHWREREAAIRNQPPVGCIIL
uniref:AIG1-type G domain-containing protein n=1 Tax=Tanacetum cinerariifolium TaxID=118510 RepID=A0A6L2NSF6_TANCI|nr:hypothetical protein [Tanacetum cinerariifolium]